MQNFQVSKHTISLEKKLEILRENKIILQVLTACRFTLNVKLYQSIFFYFKNVFDPGTLSTWAQVAE